MISLDQVLLLEEKVESAVQKIAQLNQENDALRMKCSELTKALSEKTEQLSSFSSDQSKIEEGILKALERLNSVEHSVLKAAALNQQIQSQTVSAQSANVQPINPAPVASATEAVQPEVNTATINAQNQVTNVQPQVAVQDSNINTTSSVIASTEPDNINSSTPLDQTAQEEPKETEKSDKDNGQFYIF